jgi:hypothetical protein
MTFVRSWEQVFEQRDKESDAAAAARRSNENVQRIVLWVESAVAILIALLAFGWAAVLLRCLTPAHLNGID